jgi:hypothetical protein
MLHVYNPALVAASAHRPDPHAHHAHDLRRARACEAKAARQAFIKAKMAFLQAILARVKNAFRLDERARKRASVVLPQTGRAAVEGQACS